MWPLQLQFIMGLAGRRVNGALSDLEADIGPARQEADTLRPSRVAGVGLMQGGDFGQWRRASCGALSSMGDQPASAVLRLGLYESAMVL